MKADRADKPRFKHFVAWHALIVHFPISLFGAGLLFQILHFFAFRMCFDLATAAVLLTGSVAMIPSVVSGWITWKRRYRGIGSPVFIRKIVIGFGMLVLSLAIAVRDVVSFAVGRDMTLAGHIVYAVLIFLLIAGAVLEGYYGGPLTHRPIHKEGRP